MLGKRGSQCLDVFFQISRLDFVRANRLRCFENLQEALGAVIALPDERFAANRQPCFHLRQVSLEYIEGRAPSGGFDPELVKKLHDVRPLHVCHTRTAAFIAQRLTGQPHDQRVPLRRTLPASSPSYKIRCGMWHMACKMARGIPHTCSKFCPAASSSATHLLTPPVHAIQIES